MPTEAPAQPAAGRGAAWLHVVMVGLMVLIGGLTPVAARDALREMPPLTTGFLRFSLASVCMLLTALLLPTGPRAAPAPRISSAWPRFLLAAVLCVPINQYCFLSGVHYSSSSHAGLIYSLTPVLTYLLGMLLGAARWSGRVGLATVLAFAGAALVGWSGVRGGAPAQVWGDLLLFFAVLSWSMYSVVSAPLVLRFGALRTAAIVLPVGALLYGWSLAVDGAALRPAALSARAIGGFLFISVVTSYFSYLLWLIAIGRVPVHRMAISTSLAPVVAVVSAHLWHGDPLTPWLGAGGVLLIGANILAQWRTAGRGPRTAAQ